MSIRNKFLNLRINAKKSDETMADAINSVAHDYDQNPNDVLISGGLIAIAVVLVGLMAGLAIGAFCLGVSWLLDVSVLHCFYAYMVMMAFRPTISFIVRTVVRRHVNKTKVDADEFNDKIM